MIKCYAALDRCKNMLQSYGMICVKCGRCGRVFKDGELIQEVKGAKPLEEKYDKNREVQRA